MQVSVLGGHWTVTSTDLEIIMHEVIRQNVTSIGYKWDNYSLSLICTDWDILISLV